MFSKILVFGAMLSLNAAFAADNLTVVNSASLSGGPLAPGAIISIFGPNLAGQTAVTPDAANPPTTLGGVQVTVGTVSLGLDFVSRNQINAVLPFSAPLGAQTITVKSASGTFTGPILIDANAAPGLFSMTGDGTHDGAIVDALTFKLGAFTASAPVRQSYLSIFLTGLDIAARPEVTVGGVSVPVLYFGNAPCCAGLEQINIHLTDDLAGAGRVPVIVRAGTRVSNVVEIVILPQAGNSSFPKDKDNETRHREIAGIAYIPNSSFALLADENDDVVRLIDIGLRKITRTIALAEDSEPVALAVNGAGTIAVIAERGKAKVALLDLSTYTVIGEIPVGTSPIAVAIRGNLAFIANEGSSTVTVIDLTAKAVVKTIAVGQGPRGIASDLLLPSVWVTNQNEGTISMIDVASLAVTGTIQLDSDVRPTAIQVLTGGKFLALLDVAAGNKGALLLLSLADGKITRFQANPSKGSGAGDLAVVGSNIYFANQTGGSVALLPVLVTNGVPSGQFNTIKVDSGARALAVDTKDRILLVTSQGSGTIVLIDLVTNKVTGRISAVRSSDDEDDDRKDRDQAANAPVLTLITPPSSKASVSITMTIVGTHLDGATDVIFFPPPTNMGNGNGNGNGHGKQKSSDRDSKFTASNIQVNSGGTQLSATVKIDSGATTGPRLVRVMTPNGETTMMLSTANTFTVLP